jgi:hypothetical protein
VRRLVPRIVLLVTALGAVGCARVRTARECQALAETVNPALDAIEERRRAGGESPPVLTEMAGRYDQVATELRAMRLSDPELAAAVNDQLGLYRQTARQLRALAAARDGRNVAAAAQVQLEIANDARREKLLVRRIAQLCQAP